MAGAVFENLKTAAILSSQYKSQAHPIALEVKRELESHGVAVPLVDLDGTADLERELEGVELAVLCGGDGTLLSAARRMGTRPIPTLGINLGKVGFLAHFSEESFKSLVRGKNPPTAVKIVPRMRLFCEVAHDGRISSGYALNDVTIAQGVPAKLANLQVEVDGLLATHYRADGLVISTPTGSTGYSVSLGGPILIPGIDAMCVTPHAPHDLTNRPIIVDGSVAIDIKLLSEPVEIATVLDGQEVIPLKSGCSVRVRRAEAPLPLVSPVGLSHFTLLRRKLHWGVGTLGLDSAAYRGQKQP